MNPIIISGGPGAGKTTLLTALGDLGYATLSEASRTLIEQQSQLANGILPWSNLVQFAELCRERMVRQYRLALHYDVAFVDRAIPDIIGYLKMGGCGVDASYVAASAGYHHQVFFCRPEASIYVQDDVRPHSFEQALELHQSLIEAYTELGYQVVDVPWGSVAQRVNFVCAQVKLTSNVIN